ncbi:hypothetical protein [Nitrococcus mobilis]|uniref:hypothetical protein n=1 Tax=Nitrococcus mobilis TaxID=35797 RepID=UPI0012E99C52|nr:hypothetical protein [Nitrococcus mobilis]
MQNFELHGCARCGIDETLAVAGDYELLWAKLAMDETDNAVGGAARLMLLLRRTDGRNRGTLAVGCLRAGQTAFAAYV